MRTSDLPVVQYLDEQTMELRHPEDNAMVVSAVLHALAELGFSETRRFLLASAVSELSTNIIKYAGRGSMTLRTASKDGRVGFEAVAKDDGPGIPDVELALADNVSTGGGLGMGLSSVRRIADEFFIESRPGAGVEIVIRKWM